VELVNIEECEVTVKLDCDACLQVAEALRRAARETGPGEQTLQTLWESLQAGLQAAAFASSIYAEHSHELRTARTYDNYRERHMAPLVPPHQR
jgi:hypothetical protein